MFPDVPFDNGSSKENQSEHFVPSIFQNAGNDASRTREFFDVPLDNTSSMKNLTKVFCQAKAIVKEANNSNLKEKDIPTTRAHPGVTFDSESIERREKERVNIPVTVF